MHPVIGAAIVGGVLYLLFGDDQKEKDKKQGQKKEEKTKSPQPTVAELRAQLKKAIKEKKARELQQPKVAPKTESKVLPVSPPKALQPGSTTSGYGKKPERK